MPPQAASPSLSGSMATFDHRKQSKQRCQEGDSVENSDERSGHSAIKHCSITTMIKLIETESSTKRGLFC